jgi:UDP-N-acetylglucosamine:LPS N-acetylglucosamine transferase
LQKTVRDLLSTGLGLKIHVVCGENEAVLQKLNEEFGNEARVRVYGKVESLAPLMELCGSVITKPGISTLLEAQAAARKIFLLPGMPVAEDNNARFARKEFQAVDFTTDAFGEWYRARLPLREARAQA